MKSGCEGYAGEKDFANLASIASVPFEVVVESAPNRLPRIYGDGDPKARFIFKEISDAAGPGARWDVDAVNDHSTKRRRVTGN